MHAFAASSIQVHHPAVIPHAQTIGARVVASLFGAQWSRPWIPWVLVGTATTLLASTTLEHLDHGLPCLFHLVTGVPCPTCGLTHALVAAMHGDIQASWHYHAFGLPVLAGLLFMIIEQIWWFCRRTCLLRLERALLRYPLTWVVGACWITYSVARWFMPS